MTAPTAPADHDLLPPATPAETPSRTDASTFAEPDVPAELTAVFRDLAALAKPLQDLLKVKPVDAAALTQLAKLRPRLPAPEALADEMRAVTSRLDALIRDANTARQASFGRWERRFLDAARAGGAEVKELDSAWRVGPLELVVDRSQARARARYNQEDVVSWTPVAGANDLSAVVARADEQLRKAELPEAQLTDTFWRAYEAVRARRQREGKGIAELVPLPEFYREVRVELVRSELSGPSGSAAKRITRTEMPAWAFLYNADRYRRAAHGISVERRLGFQTGGQSEAREIGMVLNGLDAAASYKKFCYVRVTPPGGGE